MFVQRVKQAMEEKGISQADLVKLTGISKGSISQYLSGKNIPRQKKLNAIANALNVTPEWLTESENKKITVQQAAELMGLDVQSVRVGMQVGALPIGSVWKAEGKRKYTYYISPKKFTEYTGIKLT